MTQLNREAAVKKAAKYYLETSPNHPLAGIDYTLLAKKVINGSASKIEQYILLYAGLEWGVYITDDFEEYEQLKLREWLSTP